MEQTDFQHLCVELGLRIRAYRKSRGLNQAELAEKCSMEASNLNRIEKGRTNPTFKSIYLIAEGLNIPIEKLIKDL